MEGEQTSNLGPSAPLAWVAIEFPLKVYRVGAGVGGTGWTVGSTRDKAGEAADGVLTQN